MTMVKVKDAYVLWHINPVYITRERGESDESLYAAAEDLALHCDGPLRVNNNKYAGVQDVTSAQGGKLKLQAAPWLRDIRDPAKEIPALIDFARAVYEGRAPDVFPESLLDVVESKDQP